MNYRHVFHAGNFADVFKHVILVSLLKALQRKTKGFAYIETHAGAGRYDLSAVAARKTGEFRYGIARLWGATRADPLAPYLDAVRDVNHGQRLRYYPGSPRIARFLLRAQDRIQLCESVPSECERLRAEFVGDKQVQVRRGDGYAALKGWLPPPERRGLVLIDPSYENVDEWERAYDAITFAVERWPSGIYAAWYPLKTGVPVDRFKARLANAGLPRVLLTELMVWPDDAPFRLNGCGVLVINPPWRLEKELENLAKPLVEKLKRGSTLPRIRIEWLVPE